MWAGALCAADPVPDDWYATTGQEVARAVRVCAQCPLVDACRDAGEGETFGVWGGVPRQPLQVRVLGQALERERRAQAQTDSR